MQQKPNNMGGKLLRSSPCRGFVIWDKKQPEDISFASCEFAWTSFDTSARTFYYSPLQEKGQRIHPTQKPVALYEWLLMKYAKEGWRILDTHLGSGSSRIAAYNLGFEFVGCEIEPTYFQLQEQRFADHTAQERMW
jgi:site-specific DNA-methyltransferase (adenine-specific)